MSANSREIGKNETKFFKGEDTKLGDVRVNAKDEEAILENHKNIIADIRKTVNKMAKDPDCGIMCIFMKDVGASVENGREGIGIETKVIGKTGGAYTEAMPEILRNILKDMRGRKKQFDNEDVEGTLNSLLKEILEDRRKK